MDQLFGLQHRRRTVISIQKYLSILAFMAFTMHAHAQLNPHQGYIITNDNDSIYGMIDFRSGEKNATNCSFCQSGDSIYRNYSPQELTGYRLTDSGVYYVSRTFPIKGVQKRIFAEYLVKGSVSLFRYEGNHREYFYLVDEQGAVAEVYNYDAINSSYSLAEKRKAVGQAAQMLSRSKEATKQLFEKSVSTERMVDIVRDYNETYCTDNGNSITYFYNSKASSHSSIHLGINAGISFANYELYDVHKNVTLPFVGASLEWQFPRLNPGISVQAMINVAYCSVTTKMSPYQITTLDGLNYYQSDIVDSKIFRTSVRLGCGYRITPHKKFSPFVRGGLLTEFIHYNVTNKNSNGRVYPQKTLPQLGVYAGAGLDLSLGRHRLTLGAIYDKALLKEDYMHLSSAVSVLIEYLF